MKSEERLSHLLEQLPDTMLQQALEPQNTTSASPRFPWKRITALAACAAIALGVGFGLKGRQNTPPSDVQSPYEDVSSPHAVIFPVSGSHDYASQVLHIAYLPAGNRLAEYHQVEFPAESFSIVEAYAGLDGWYQTAEYDTSRYLIHQEEDESYSLWEFSGFTVMDDAELAEVEQSLASGDSLWAQLEWFSLDLDFTPYPYAQVLRDIYGVSSAEDIVSITLTPGNMDNTDAGKALQAEIGTHRLTDRGEISTVYNAISTMSCLGGNHWDRIDLGSSGDNLLDSVRKTRYLTLDLANGSKITTLKYTAAGGQFYEYGGIAYAPLEDTFAEQLNTLFRISE